MSNDTWKSGTVYLNRRALHDEKLHIGLMNGISPSGDSIVLSGGYIDDIDEGAVIIYTGQGGRDAQSGRQISDQTLERGNKGLAQQYMQGNPVRVTRGSQLDSRFAPPSGYRYDGLYRITSYWREKGRDGYFVYRFRLERLPDQPPIGQLALSSSPSTRLKVSDPPEEYTITPQRELTTYNRLLRNSAIVNHVKQLYQYTCQICNVQLNTPAGPYAEGCHIRPLGAPHNGPDTIDNVLCLCPNCHVLLDMYAYTIDHNFIVMPHAVKLRVHHEHAINQSHIAYRNSIVGQS
jgi:putative restriction endonuclease